MHKAQLRGTPSNQGARGPWAAAISGYVPGLWGSAPQLLPGSLAGFLTLRCADIGSLG